MTQTTLPQPSANSAIGRKRFPAHLQRIEGYVECICALTNDAELFERSANTEAHLNHADLRNEFALAKNAISADTFLHRRAKIASLRRRLIVEMREREVRIKTRIIPDVKKLCAA